MTDSAACSKQAAHSNGGIVMLGFFGHSHRRKIDQMLMMLRSIEQGVIAIRIRLDNMEKRMSKELDDLKAAVAKTTAVEQSAIDLIKGVASQLADVAGDKAATEALANELDTRANELSTAITSNTPAATTPDTPATPPADSTPA